MGRQRSSVPVQKLYDAYEDWASEAGAEVLSTIAFGRAMTTLGLSKKKVGGLIHYRSGLPASRQKVGLGAWQTGY